MKSTEITYWSCGKSDCGLLHRTLVEALECLRIVEITEFICNYCSDRHDTREEAEKCCKPGEYFNQQGK